MSVTTSPMVGRICPLGWNRIEASENPGAPIHGEISYHSVAQGFACLRLIVL